LKPLYINFQRKKTQFQNCRFSSQSSKNKKFTQLIQHEAKGVDCSGKFIASSRMK